MAVRLPYRRIGEFACFDAEGRKKAATNLWKSLQVVERQGQ